MAAEGVRPHDGAGGGGQPVGHPHGEAVWDAEAVHQPLDLVAGGDEGVGHPLVDDQDRATRPEQLEAGAEDVDRARNVVKGLEDRRPVIPTRQGGVGGVADSLRDRCRAPWSIGERGDDKGPAKKPAPRRGGVPRKSASFLTAAGPLRYTPPTREPTRRLPATAALRLTDA